MRQYDSTPGHPHSFCLITLLFILLGLSACATPPPSDEMPGGTPNETADSNSYWFLRPAPEENSTPDEMQDGTVADESTNNADNTSQIATEATTPSPDRNDITVEPADSGPAATELTQANPASADSEPATPEPTAGPVTQEPEPATSLTETEAVPESVSIETACKNSPYSKYEEQARTSIARGLSATTAGTYGVGFRNLDEHKEWEETHNALFTAVNQACLILSKCAKQHPEDKTTQCANEAKQFDEWQNLAARFAEKAKQSETTQPPKICSFTADLDDAARCFHALADNIDNTCTTSDCKETSDCWRGIGFLDGAINQAASACAFVRTPLAECRGYVTATQRRKNKFERCAQMQEGLNIRIIPVL